MGPLGRGAIFPTTFPTVQHHGQRYSFRRTSAPRHFIASEPHTPWHHHQDDMHLLDIPGQAWPIQQGWGCHRNLVTHLYQLHCLHHMLAHVSPILACEVSTVMPILQVRKLRFRAGSD